MPRCPECGKWIWTFLSTETECPKCGAILKIHRVFIGRFISTWLETLRFNPSSAGARYHFARDPSFSKQEIVPGGLEGELGEATLPDYVEDEEQGGEDRKPDPSYTPLYADRVRTNPEGKEQNKSTKALQQEPTSRGENVREGRCIFCHALMRQPDSRFCSNCGARLHFQPRVVASTYLEIEPEAENQAVFESRETHCCMVCNQELTEKHDVFCALAAVNQLIGSTWLNGSM